MSEPRSRTAVAAAETVAASSWLMTRIRQRLPRRPSRRIAWFAQRNRGVARGTPVLSAWRGPLQVGFSVSPAKLPGPKLRRRVGDYEYEYNPLAVAAPVAAIAFFAAMAGISGGSLIVPVLVVLRGVALRIAVGTNPFLILVSSAAGFTAHLARGGFDPMLGAVPGAAAVAGSQLGSSRLHARLSDKILRVLFSSVMVFAAAVMLAKALG